jgi:hypothetical protein
LVDVGACQFLENRLIWAAHCGEDLSGADFGHHPEDATRRNPGPNVRSLYSYPVRGRHTFAKRELRVRWGQPEVWSSKRDYDGPFSTPTLITGKLS